MEKSKTIRRRRSDCSWKKEPNTNSAESAPIHYPDGPIAIACSWNPIDRAEKPPYSYATIIGHAILTSKDRRLTLHDIYVWITENYPFYSNETQGWQNSIRHNLSLHKSFIKVDRDANAQTPPRKGCFWTIRQGKEKFFIDNLQKPVNSLKRQQSLSHLAGGNNKRQHFLRRTSSTILPPSTASSSASSPSRLFSSFRTTNDVPDSEQHLLPSSDLLSSPSSSSLSGSSPTTYHQLFYNVPESTMSYNVYPAEQADLFNNDYYVHSNSSTSGSHLPSLSPCDAYSTTSSYNNDYQSMKSSSNRSSYGVAVHNNNTYAATAYKNNNSSPFSLQSQPDALMMEWSSIPNSILHENFASSADYYLQPSRHNSMDFSSFHR